MKVAFVPCLFLLALLCGCQNPPTFPPANLQSPGWTARQGQAIWTAKHDEEGVAGELLLATRADGACFVQFSKPPFTLATARTEGGAWSIELQSAQHVFGGRGRGPVQFVWFALADALRESPNAGPLARPWSFESRGAEGWRLMNAKTGEMLEGYFSP